ncbi:MarR family winged helix-turn-helix transcriptional regulator [Citrobacter portucalensis]|uniref:MarR family winged helix-turn-helix transcriptional regulator n=1 Tax=Citrobacter portucalensis TaxID=1639133 RepID=UPI001C63CE67|nr:MarR family transcriptional regulator [Citrobacter portucalensis]MBW7621462.1 MarR family transcriptional regulator [Citrobacter portucalensis]MBW7640380.1 MarR family transcriptional regulator [Citrobacter portucalensis]MCA2135010.1 MarR family transcriptional regulator [Citrobacter portucalensis]MCA2145096.1 MarR family transcriptional regulator [Citrobacter portucalensis]MCA2149970.1 MarR family transcriptional regulator [Citrobacter portucalensis]
MPDMSLFDVLDRLSSLTRMWFRQHPLLADLQPVQLSALMYLARCNRYSNTPLGVTDYLGLTKGTVSQSLKLLENKGLIVRKPDDRDKRSVHLHLSESANTLLDALLPPTFLVVGETAMGERATVLKELLFELLRGIQRTNNVPGFGLCHSCRFHQKIDGQGFCNLTKERLSEEDSLLICREHQPPET